MSCALTKRDHPLRVSEVGDSFRAFEVLDEHRNERRCFPRRAQRVENPGQRHRVAVLRSVEGDDERIRRRLRIVVRGRVHPEPALLSIRRVEHRVRAEAPGRDGRARVDNERDRTNSLRPRGRRGEGADHQHSLNYRMMHKWQVTI